MHFELAPNLRIMHCWHGLENRTHPSTEPSPTRPSIPLNTPTVLITPAWHAKVQRGTSMASVDEHWFATQTACDTCCYKPKWTFISTNLLPRHIQHTSKTVKKPPTDLQDASKRPPRGFWESSGEANMVISHHTSVKNKVF